MTAIQPKDSADVTASHLVTPAEQHRGSVADASRPPQARTRREGGAAAAFTEANGLSVDLLRAGSENLGAFPVASPRRPGDATDRGSPNRCARVHSRAGVEAPDPLEPTRRNVMGRQRRTAGARRRRSDPLAVRPAMLMRRGVADDLLPLGRPSLRRINRTKEGKPCIAVRS